MSTPFGLLRSGLALTIVILIGVSAFWVRLASRQTAPMDERLVVAAAHLDFGVVYEDMAFPWTLPIENRTSNDITIHDFISSCACVAIEPQTLVVPAGQKADVRLTLDLRQPPPQSSTETVPVADFAIQILPHFEGELPTPTLWTLRGRVRRFFTLSPASVNFGDNLVRGQPFESATVTLTALTALQTLTATSDPPLATVEVSGKGNQYALRITPRDSLPPGSWEARMLIQAFTHDGVTVRGQVQIRGCVLSEIYFLPAAIAFGARPLRETAEETVVLLSRSGHPFDVTGLEGTPDGLTVEHLATRSRHAQQFRVSQRISHSGDHASTIRFLVRGDDDMQSVQVPLSVSYHGMPGH
jgi:hypothetical protein